MKCPHCNEILPDTAIKCKFCRKSVLRVKQRPIVNIEGDYPPWKIDELFIPFVIVFFLGIIPGFITLFLETLIGNEALAESSFYQIILLIIDLLPQILIVAVIYFIVTMYHKMKFVSGLKLNKPKNSILFLLAPLTAAMFLLTWLINKFQLPLNIPIEKTTLTLPMYILILFNIIFVEPIVEQIFWTGFVYPAINRKYGMHIAIILTSVLFTLFCLPNSFVAVCSALLLGFSVVALRALTQSTLACVLLHISYNLVTSIVYLIFTK